MAYASHEECHALEPRSYMRAPINDSVRRVVLPSAFLVILELHFEDHEKEVAMNLARKQLAPITLRVEFHDIYDNKMSVERDFQWFARHEINEAKYDYPFML